MKQEVRKKEPGGSIIYENTRVEMWGIKHME